MRVFSSEDPAVPTQGLLCGGLSGGDPFKQLLWLANAPRPAGHGLAIGTVVTTGSLRGMSPACRGQAFGHYGGLGSVEVEFV